MRGRLTKIGDKPCAISIVGMNAAIFAKDQRVRRPDQGGAICDNICKAQHGFLVRDGHVQPHKAKMRQHAQHFGQIRLRDIHRDIMTLDAIAAQPIAVQSGRAAVRNR